MSKHLVVTTTGHDRTGIVEEVTELLSQFDANIEASRMARLGGEFAMIMLVSARDDQIEPLRDAVRTLREADYKVTTRFTKSGDAQSFTGFVPYEIKVRGADHVGIIHDVARYLAKHGAHIETMETDVVQAPMTGTPLFTMEAVVFIPPNVSFQELREALEKIGDDLGVDTEAAPHVD